MAAATPHAGPPLAAASSLAVRILEVAPEDSGATLVATLSALTVPVTLIGPEAGPHAMVLGAVAGKGEAGRGGGVGRPSWGGEYVRVR
jgi:hypothetical protein